jgi:hypothetical protein
MEDGLVLLGIAGLVCCCGILKLLSPVLAIGTLEVQEKLTFFSAADSAFHSSLIVFAASMREIPFISPVAHLSFVKTARALRGFLGILGSSIEEYF